MKQSQKTCPSCNCEDLTVLPIRTDVSEKDLTNYPDILIPDSKFSQCNSCGLIFATTRQSVDESELYYKAFLVLEHRDYTVYPPPKEFIRNQAQYADELGELLHKEHIFHSGQRIIQLRSESGHHLTRLRSQYGLHELFGLDYFESNIRYAKQDLGLVNIALLNPKLDESPFLDNQYNVVLSNHQITHALDLKATFAMLLRLLGRDGTLVLHGEVDHQPAIRSAWRKRINNYHKQLLTSDSIITVCKQFGLQPRKIHDFENGLRWAIPQHSMAVIAHRA